MLIRFFLVSGGHHQKLGYVYHRLSKVVTGQNAGRYNRYVCGVLNALAQTPQNCDMYLNFIADVEEGRSEKIETGANDVTLTIQKNGVHVDIEVNEDWIDSPEANFTLEEWKKVLQGWRRFLEMPQRLDSSLEIEI